MLYMSHGYKCKAFLTRLIRLQLSVMKRKRRCSPQTSVSCRNLAGRLQFNAYLNFYNLAPLGQKTWARGKEQVILVVYEQQLADLK